MQRLETCVERSEAGRVLCHRLMFLTVFFYLTYKMKYSLSTGKPEQLLSLMCVCFFFQFPEVERSFCGLS